MHKFLLYLAVCAAAFRIYGAEDFKHENTDANLMSLMSQIHSAIEGKNVKLAAALTRTLIPDAARQRVAFKVGADAEQVKQIAEAIEHLTGLTDEDAAYILDHGRKQSNVLLHKATAEEFGKDGDVISEDYRSITNGAKVCAKALLNKQTVFYNITFAEPGSQAGTKYFFFYWDGAHWSMLGPVWQALKVNSN